MHFLRLLDNKNEREHETPAFFQFSKTTSKLPERPLAAQSPRYKIPHKNLNCRSHFFPGIEFLGNLRAAIQKICNPQKQAGMPDRCIFLRFYFAKTRGNARGLHFLYICLNSTEQNMLFSIKQKCERGSYFHMFFAILPNKKNEECKHEFCVFSTPLN